MSLSAKKRNNCQNILGVRNIIYTFAGTIYMYHYYMLLKVMSMHPMLIGNCNTLQLHLKLCSFRIATCCKFLLLIMTAVVSSCSSGSSPKGESQEGRAVSYVKKHLERNTKLVDYQVVKGQMPIEMMADELKNYRDIVFKARLDYGACKVRGLAAGMEQALAKIKQCQEGINGIADELAKTQANSEHIFVLATIEEKSALGKRQSNLIAVLNPETMEIEKWVPVTTPVKNNAIIVANAMNGSLLDDGMDSNENVGKLADATENPIVRFILKSTAK